MVGFPGALGAVRFERLGGVACEETKLMPTGARATVNRLKNAKRIMRQIQGIIYVNQFKSM